MPAPARAAAFRALVAVARGRLDLGEATARAHAGLDDPRDRALLSEILTGTLRWQGALDYQLARLSGRPLAALDDEVLASLRLGAYQLTHLTRVPPSAVVNDAVSLVRRAGKASATGFVNGILRRLGRERETLAWPPPPAESDAPGARDAAILHLTHAGSHPRWLVERWVDRYGLDDATAWVRFNNTPPPMCLRANVARMSREALADALAAEGVTTAPTAVAPHGLVVTSGLALQTAAAREGLFLVQDEASQLIPELVRPADEARVLDACAAPGGKSVALASRLGPRGRLIAADVRPRRLARLATTLSLAGVKPLVVRIAERGPWSFAPGAFTDVLVDAPCSGLGTLRRDPDIRWRRQPADLASCAAVQGRLLDEAAEVVADQGRLVYSTCSSEPEENEDVVRAFLARHPEFRVRPLATIAGLPPSVVSLADESGFLRTDPARHGLEAFFGAVVERGTPAIC